MGKNLQTTHEPGLTNYLLTKEKINLLKNFNFVCLQKNVDIKNLKTEFLNSYNEKGVYFWIMRFQGNLYGIYVGKAASLGRRLGDYRRAFQPGSPNDYKLRILQDYLNYKYGGAAELDLYFTHAQNHSEMERKVIHSFNLLINPTAGTEVDKKEWEESKNKICDVYKEYYAEIFNRRLPSSPLK